MPLYRMRADDGDEYEYFSPVDERPQFGERRLINGKEYERIVAPPEDAFVRPDPGHVSLGLPPGGVGGRTYESLGIQTVKDRSDRHFGQPIIRSKQDITDVEKASGGQFIHARPTDPDRDGHLLPQSGASKPATRWNRSSD